MKTELINKLSEHDKMKFDLEYNTKKKSKLTAWLLYLFLGWHYGYLGKWMLQIAYILTFGGWFIWIIIDLFRINSMVNQYNEELELDILLKF
jgi:hypothetical protein